MGSVLNQRRRVDNSSSNSGLLVLRKLTIPAALLLPSHDSFHVVTSEAVQRQTRFQHERKARLLPRDARMRADRKAFSPSFGPSKAQLISSPSLRKSAVPMNTCWAVSTSPLASTTFSQPTTANKASTCVR